MRKASAGFATAAETFTGKQDIKSLGFGDALKRLAASNSLTQELANKIGELVVLTDKRMALIEKGAPETSS